MENDLISRSALMDDIDHTVLFSVGNSSVHTAEQRGAARVIARIKAIPAVDAVEVVRCPSCKYHEDIDGYHECRKLRMRLPNDAEFFCKYGQRREEGDV